MPHPEWLSLFTNRRHLARTLSHLLVLGLVMLADGWVLVRVARRSGVYLALALEAAVAVVAVIIVGSTIVRQIGVLRTDAFEGQYRPREFARLAAVVTAAVLLVLPGFVSDAVGMMLYLPPGRQLFMTGFVLRNRDELPTVYEYLKLAVFSDDAPQ